MRNKRSVAIVAAVLALVLCVGAYAMSSPGAQVAAADHDNTATPTSNVMLLAAATPSQADSIFTDVAADAWYAEAIAYCYDEGLMVGTSDTAFSPNTELSRAMVVTILHRAAGTPAVTGASSFTDVESGTWYSDAVAWSEQNDIVAGYGNGLFGTNDPVTREQLITILWRYDGNKTATATPAYADTASSSTWAADAVAWASENSISNTKDGNRLDPLSSATRAETAYMFKQLLSPSESEPGGNETDGDAPTVFMTSDISAEGLMAIYEALEANPTGNIAIKVTTGEPPNSNYLREELIGDLARYIDGTIVESNTAYGGSRSSDDMHIQVAKDHGFYDMTEKGFDLMDAGGQSITLPVVGGEVLTENYVGANFANYDYFVVLSHFKGHGMAGLGGAVKNISIGIGSAAGKTWIHTGGQRTSGGIMGGSQDDFLKAMAEAGKSVVDSLDSNILYINVMNRLSVSCDCDGNPREPDMHDIGILASYDPVALDKACVDLVEAAPDGASLMNQINSRNGVLCLEHGDKIGLGSLTYNLVSIDD